MGEIYHLSEIEAEKDTLTEHLKGLLVDHLQLNALTIYFREGYGDLYNKLWMLKMIVQREMNITGDVFLLQDILCHQSKSHLENTDPVNI